MKTLVMTVIFIVAVVTDAFCGNNQKAFAYNEVMNGNQAESQIVYKVEDYLSYKWSEKDNDWNLLVEHSTDNGDVLLLAMKYN